jgi:hypothetical protein
MMSNEDIALIVVGLWLLGYSLELKACPSDGCQCVKGGPEAQTGRKMVELPYTAAPESEDADVPTSEEPEYETEAVGYELGFTTGNWVGMVQGAGGAY